MPAVLISHLFPGRSHRTEHLHPQTKTRRRLLQDVLAEPQSTGICEAFSQIYKPKKFRVLREPAKPALVRKTALAVTHVMTRRPGGWAWQSIEGCTWWVGSSSCTQISPQNNTVVKCVLEWARGSRKSSNSSSSAPGLGPISLEQTQFHPSMFPNHSCDSCTQKMSRFWVSFKLAKSVKFFSNQVPGLHLAKRQNWSRNNVPWFETRQSWHGSSPTSPDCSGAGSRSLCPLC